MTQKKLTQILTLALCAVAVIGCVIAICLMGTEAPRDDVEFSVPAASSIGGLCPGSTQESAVDIKANTAGKYTIKVSFSSDGDASIARHITVAVKVGGTELASAALNDLLGGDTLSFDMTFTAGEAVTAAISYTMSPDVDNAAQGASANFATQFAAVKL